MIVVAMASASSPGEAQAAALADVRKLPEKDAKYARYLWVPGWIDGKDAVEFAMVIRHHANELSKEAEFGYPALIALDVWRIDLRDYGTDPKTYEKLAAVDVHFHSLIEETVEEDVEYGVWYDTAGRQVENTDSTRVRFEKTRTVKQKRKVKRLSAQAPWLDAKASTELIERTHSEAAILCATKWWIWTVIQADRRGAGYYDFLGLKKRDDFFNLIAFDKKQAQKARREVAAIIKNSGVAQLNRQVFRFGAVDAGYWVTLDVFDTESERKNAISSLDKDYVHDAEEHYGVLPNRLFAYYLSDKDGVAQDSAPDKIGPDETSTSKDGRIHACLSCIRCHKDGIRPLDDHGRKLFRVGGPVKLQSPDYEVLKRLRQLYLGELQRYVEKDRDEYSFALRQLTGWTPAELSRVYTRWWKRLNDDEVTVEVMAAELGTTPAHFAASIKWAAKQTGGIDNTTAGLLLEPPDTIKRQHFEERYALFQTYIRGYIPQ